MQTTRRASLYRSTRRGGTKKKSFHSSSRRKAFCGSFFSKIHILIVLTSNFSLFFSFAHHKEAEKCVSANTARCRAAIVCLVMDRLRWSLGREFAISVPRNFRWESFCLIWYEKRQNIRPRFIVFWTWRWQGSDVPSSVPTQCWLSFHGHLDLLYSKWNPLRAALPEKLRLVTISRFIGGLETNQLKRHSILDESCNVE